MRSLRLPGSVTRAGFVLTGLLSYTLVLPAAPSLTLAPATVGNRLQQSASVKLGEQAPDDGVQITLRSSDPARLRFSKAEDQPGSESITILVRQGYRESREFWLQALDSSGTVTYSAEAPGYEKGTATVTLAPSAIVISGPFKAPKFVTTTGAAPAKISLFAACLDSSMKIVAEQAVSSTVELTVLNSDRKVGHIAEHATIPAGRSAVVLAFQPASEGETTVALGSLQGFAKAADMSSVIASVKKPGLALSDQLVIGQNLQVAGVLSLGEFSPAGGLTVTLTSEDKSKLLLSKSADEVGSGSITLTIPENQTNGRYFLQALGRSGNLTYTASAPGYRSRTAEVTLAPSGVIITPASQGPPDEAHVLRKEAPDAVHRFSVDLAKAKAPEQLVLWTAQLDPVTHRSADITVQPLRAGVSLNVHLTNSNAAVGQLQQDLKIPAGSDHAVVEFKALSIGSTEITVETPKDFTTSANAVTVIGYVR